MNSWLEKQTFSPTGGLIIAQSTSRLTGMAATGTQGQNLFCIISED
jgi:hypothetical protein